MKKNILLIGSDSGIAKKLIKNILNKEDNLFTVSRREKCKFNSKKHFQIDLSILEDVKKLNKELSNYFFDSFIFLPGIFSIKSINEEDEVSIYNNLMVNLTAPMLITIPVIKNMLLKKNGTLIYIGSSSSYAGFKNTSVYCSSKHGLLGFCRALAAETREKNIRTTLISPGTISTKMASPLIKGNNFESFIDPNEVSDLIFELIYNQTKSMWQEEIILKRRSYS